MKTYTKILLGCICASLLPSTMFAQNNIFIGGVYEETYGGAHFRTPNYNNYSYEGGAHSHITQVTTTDYNNDGTVDDSRYFTHGSTIVGAIQLYGNSSVEYAIPTGTCMSKNGLPQYGKEVETFNRYKTNTFAKITNSSATFEVYDATKHSIDSYSEDIKASLPVMQYSTDGGITYHRYFHRDQEGLPTGDCDITNFKIEVTNNATLNGRFRTLYTYYINVGKYYTEPTLANPIKVHYKIKGGTEKDFIETETLTNDAPTHQDSNRIQTCTDGQMHIRINANTTPVTPVTPPSNPTPPTIPVTPVVPVTPVTPPSTPTTPPAIPVVPPAVPVTPVTPIVPPTSGGSGPGGYIPVEPPKTMTPPKLGEFLPKEESKQEMLDFSMNFTDIKEVIIPKVLPKMGATTTATMKAFGLDKILVETKLNTEDFRLAGSESTELTHWLQVVANEDKNRDSYIVIPSSGLVVPVSNVDSEDSAYTNFVQGKSEDFLNYATNGAVELPNFSQYGKIGNKVIGGHSSYWKNSAARYKTHFQKIIGMELGKEIWIYKKNPTTGGYDRYVYVTEASYNTSANDTSILMSDHNSTLTLFTCTPIGGSEGRWVVKAKFSGKY